MLGSGRGRSPARDPPERRRLRLERGARRERCSSPSRLSLPPLQAFRAAVTPQPALSPSAGRRRTAELPAAPAEQRSPRYLLGFAERLRSPSPRARGRGAAASRLPAVCPAPARSSFRTSAFPQQQLQAGAGAAARAPGAPGLGALRSLTEVSRALSHPPRWDGSGRYLLYHRGRDSPRRAAGLPANTPPPVPVPVPAAATPGAPLAHGGGAAAAGGGRRAGTAHAPGASGTRRGSVCARARGGGGARSPLPCGRELAGHRTGSGSGSGCRRHRHVRRHRAGVPGDRCH